MLELLLVSSFLLGYLTSFAVQKFQEKERIIPDRVFKINGWDVLFCIDGEKARVHKRRGNKITYDITSPVDPDRIDALIESIENVAKEEKIKNNWIFCKLYESGILKMSR